MKNFLAHTAPTRRPINDNWVNSHLTSHPYFGSVCALVGQLAQQKNLAFTSADIGHAARGILSCFQPERLDELFGGVTAEPDAEAMWNINNYFDSVSADNMTHIFATALKLDESLEELRRLSDRLFDALKGDNPVGAPTLVWPSITMIRHVAIVMRRFDPRPITVDTVLDVMTRVAQEGAINPRDDLSALWELSVRLFKSPYEFNEGGNVVKGEFR